MKNVLLCGCGNIGFRHLQAMAAMPTRAAITVVEPNAAAHPRIADFMGGATAAGHRFTLTADVPQDDTAYDLAVIATSANTRRAAFQAITDRHQVRVMVLEKVLFQTLADLDAVGAALTEKGIAAYVNCGRRYFPGYREAKARWQAGRPLDVTVAGAAFGLASNGIHLIDLAEYLNDAALVSLDAAGLRPGSVEAKRDGCVEVFGRITGTLSNGARLTIDCADDPAISIAVTVAGQGLSARIDELARQITEGGATGPFAAKHVSETWEIHDEALTRGTTGLTPYADSARQHRHFLTALNRHLGRAEDAVCPIS